MHVMNQLPPLNPLRAFEAAGRLKSIRKAAEELSVTAGAVSRQVQILETYLGVPLFRREARAAILTAAGEQYLAEITAHLDGIREATLKLTGVRGRSREVLKVRAYITFAMKWLIPRLSSFHDANPATEVRITASLEAVDFEHEDVDCAIRLGDGNWPHCEVDKLVANELVPVCSPDYRREAKFKNPSDLAGRTLLHSLARPDDWMHWLNAAGLTGIDPCGVEVSELRDGLSGRDRGTRNRHRAEIFGRRRFAAPTTRSTLCDHLRSWKLHLLPDLSEESAAQSLVQDFSAMAGRADARSLAAPGGARRRRCCALTGRAPTARASDRWKGLGNCRPSSQSRDVCMIPDR
jgi:LysR family glycine cleavage system transcriptional activator